LRWIESRNVIFYDESTQLREREAELDETFKKLKSVSLFRDNLDEVGSWPTKTRIQATLSQTKKPAGGKPAGYWKS
jgi:hypothetical protein